MNHCSLIFHHSLYSDHVSCNTSSSPTEVYLNNLNPPTPALGLANGNKWIWHSHEWKWWHGLALLKFCHQEKNMQVGLWSTETRYTWRELSGWPEHLPPEAQVQPRSADAQWKMPYYTRCMIVYRTIHKLSCQYSGPANVHSDSQWWRFMRKMLILLYLVFCCGFVIFYCSKYLIDTVCFRLK